MLSEPDRSMNGSTPRTPTSFAVSHLTLAFWLVQINSPVHGQKGRDNRPSTFSSSALQLIDDALVVVNLRSPPSTAAVASLARLLRRNGRAHSSQVHQEECLFLRSLSKAKGAFQAPLLDIIHDKIQKLSLNRRRVWLIRITGQVQWCHSLVRSMCFTR